MFIFVFCATLEQVFSELRGKSLESYHTQFSIVIINCPALYYQDKDSFE